MLKSGKPTLPMAQWALTLLEVERACKLKHVSRPKLGPVRCSSQDLSALCTKVDTSSPACICRNPYAAGYRRPIRVVQINYLHSKGDPRNSYPRILCNHAGFLRGFNFS